jgi:hypothetical protein
MAGGLQMNGMQVSAMYSDSFDCSNKHEIQAISDEIMEKASRNLRNNAGTAFLIIFRCPSSRVI